tara:strand:+ start:225 stop:332 length:108 start_codon:yes stop_codon:yes gene_type:complete
MFSSQIVREKNNTTGKKKVILLPITSIGLQSTGFI